MNKAKNMGVVGQVREKTWRKNIQKIMENKKMNEGKKRPNQWVTMTCAHRQKDDKQIFWKGVTTKTQRKLEGIKGMNKGDKLMPLVIRNS